MCPTLVYYSVWCQTILLKGRMQTCHKSTSNEMSAHARCLRFVRGRLVASPCRMLPLNELN